MGIFVISFRIFDDAGYAERYESVVKQIKICCHDQTYWDETTSFFVLKNPVNAQQLADYIKDNSTLDPRRDLLVAISLSAKDYGVVGKINDADLHKLMSLR